jgi:chemotaxis protein histidine kinase CheA
MNFVKSEVSKKGGTIGIRPVKGKSCEFQIALPA